MKSFQRSVFFAFIVTCICAAAACLVFGCAAPKPTPPPFSFMHPFRDANQTIEHLQGVLTAVNIVSFVVFLGSIGLLFVSALTWLSRIIMPIAGVVTAGTLAGIVSLPFAPWVIGGTLLGLAGYEAYVWYKNRPTPPPQQVTLVHK